MAAEQISRAARCIRELLPAARRPDSPLHWLELRIEPGRNLPVGHADGSRVDLPLDGLERRPAVEVYSALRRCWDCWRRTEKQMTRLPPVLIATPLPAVRELW